MESPICPLLTLALLMGCGPGSDDPGWPKHTVGKNSFTTQHDGNTREYVVHVPAGYDPEVATPVVMMFHGAGGTGEGSWNSSGWKEVGETETLLTVFPTALTVCYEGFTGELKDAPRWHSLNTNVFCPGQDLPDDIGFVGQMLDELGERYHLDGDRIYWVGFSSGGQLGARALIEMPDRLSAVVLSGGSAIPDNAATPGTLLPVAFEAGSLDDRWFGDVGLPMSEFETSMAQGALFGPLSDFVTTFDFGTDYTLSGDESTALTATFPAAEGGRRELTVTLIEGLDHSYPNTVNHPRHGAQENWAWLQGFTRPSADR